MTGQSRAGFVQPRGSREPSPSRVNIQWWLTPAGQEVPGTWEVAAMSQHPRWSWAVLDWAGSVFCSIPQRQGVFLELHKCLLWTWKETWWVSNWKGTENDPWKSPFFFSQWSEFIILRWNLSFLGEISTSSSPHRKLSPTGISTPLAQGQDIYRWFRLRWSSAAPAPSPDGAFSLPRAAAEPGPPSFLSVAGEFIQHRLWEPLNPHVQKWARVVSTTARFIAVWTVG